MPHHVWPYLLAILRRAVALGAEEVRFVTGQLPSFKISNRLQSAAEAPVRGDVVQAIHEECLGKAGPRALSPATAVKYELSVSTLGTFACEFQLEGAARSLRIAPIPGVTPAITNSPNKPRVGGSVADPDALEQTRTTRLPPSEA